MYNNNTKKAVKLCNDLKNDYHDNREKNTTARGRFYIVAKSRHFN